jgi:hypothetical protein
MKTWVTQYDEELLQKSKVFLAAADANPESRAVLTKFGFSDEERERGRQLIADTERSFTWEREGRAWNFLATTPERRIEEARHWYKDTRERYVAECFRRAEEDSGWVGFGSATAWPVSRKLTAGPVIFASNTAKIFSLKKLFEHREELRRNLALAQTDKPKDAPPPKDTALVVLAGWYERWRLLAQRVFRQRPDLMAPYGLTPGKAPPRLRSRVAQLKYGEKAAGSLPVINNPGAAPAENEDADEPDVPAAAGA